MLRYLICCTLVALSIAGGCQPQGTRSDEEVSEIVQAIRKAIFTDDKVQALLDGLKLSSKGFSSNQTAIIFENLGFAAWESASVDQMDPYVMGLTCADMVRVLKSVTFESDQLATLEKWVGVVYDLKENNRTILGVWANIFTQQDAKQIIDDAEAKKPYSCVFGKGMQLYDRLIFVVDVSGSMETSFQTDDGRTVTRLQFVAEQLDTVVTTGLLDKQEFNLMTFSNGVTAWQKGVVPHNSLTVHSAQEFIGKMRPGGGTQTYNALKAAMADPNAYAIYLLSDGEPNGSMQSIIDLAKSYHSGTDSKGNTRVVTAIFFGAGGTPSAAASAFMNNVADAGGGVFRSFV